MLESKIQRAIMDYLRFEMNCMVTKISTMKGYGQSHWPDLLVAPHLQPTFFIETKKPGEDQTEAQKITTENLRARGYIVLVARSLEEIQEMCTAAWLADRNRWNAGQLEH